MVERLLGRRRFSKGTKAWAFSERSGAPFPYREMVTEPGTGLRVHYSESDGKYNRRDVYKDPVVPPDAQQLEFAFGPPSDASAPLENTFWLSDTNTEDPLYVDERRQETVNTEDIA